MEHNITITWNTVAWTYGIIHVIGGIIFYYYCLFQEKKEAKENGTPVNRDALGMYALLILVFVPAMIMCGIVITLNQTVGRLGRLVFMAEWGPWDEDFLTPRSTK